MYKVFLFGMPRLENNGVIINIPRRKSVALLAYLVVTQQPTQREKLAALLYPDQDQTRAHSNLRRDLFDLKSALSGQVLLIERDSVGLQAADTFWVDVNEFLNHANYVRQHHQPSHPDSACADCRTRLSSAEMLYSDDFLAGFSISDSRAFEAWQFDQSEALRQQFSGLLEQLVKLHSEQREFDLALNYARRQVSLDPLNEPAQREVMRLYAWSGQLAAALRQYSEIKQLLHQELGIEPDGETTALFETIRRKGLEHPRSAIPANDELSFRTTVPSQTQNNLPTPDGSLVGRNRELEQTVHSLRDDPTCRVLTILGPGGIGKTHLAIEAARHLAEDKACPFCEGIFYVSLSGINQPDMIITAIASAIKLPLPAETVQREQQLINFLQTKRVLLLLDNFEQLIGPQSIRIILALVDRPLQSKLLITSRTRLNIHLEHVLPLQGLGIPKIPPNELDLTEDSLGEYGATQLFLERVKILNPDYRILHDDLRSIIQICSMVDGMPLGIELAAAWSDILSPGEILREIQQSFEFLAVKWFDKPEKHHSLHAVFDGSWELLTQEESSALMNLTVFPGSFTRQSAMAVSGASIEIIQSLNNKSWLKSLDDRTFQIHELLCQYANEKLQSDPAAWLQTKHRYIGYYSTQLEGQWLKIKGPEQKEAIDWIGSEFGKIRLAWQWLIEDGQVEFAVYHLLPVLFRYSETKGKPLELLQLIDFTLGTFPSMPADSSPTLVNSTLLVAKAAYDEFGSPMRVSGTQYHIMQKELICQSWQVIGDLETLKRIGFWGLLATYLYGLIVDISVAIEYLQELVDYYRLENQRWSLAYALFLFGSAQVFSYFFSLESLPLPRGAEPILIEAQSIFTDLGDTSEASYVFGMIGVLDYIYGKYTNSKYYEAVDKLQTAVALQEQLGEYVQYALLMERLALCYMKLGDHQSVLRCYQQTRVKLQAEGEFGGAASALHLESLYSSRYSDIAHALLTRQESIALYRQEGNKIGAAWGTWEMGELFRISGDLTQAQQWFDQARSLFNQLGERPGFTFINRADGDLAAMVGDWQAAKIHFGRSVELAREMHQIWALAYALCGLAKANARLGDTISALGHIKEAVQIAWRMDKHELNRYTLAGYTQILISSGENEQAVELGTWIINDVLTWNETREQVKALLSTIRLSPELFSAAVERSNLLDLETIITRFEKMNSLLNP